METLASPMKICVDKLTFETNPELDWKDLTPMIREGLAKSGLTNGVMNVFVPGSTGAVISIEAENGCLSDLARLLRELVPPQGEREYEHEKAWRDGNGHSHIRATLLGPGISLPFVDKELQLGVWQQIVFLECDVRARKRTVIVQCLGT